MPVDSPSLLYLHGLNSSPTSHKASQLLSALTAQRMSFGALARG
ncbi:MAG: YqiA/YcfP family alpha/beta fold hydrolase, partial [Pseudomonadota bacterium]